MASVPYSSLRLAFIGFGFDETNLERLEINKQFEDSGEIYCPAYGFNEKSFLKKVGKHIEWHTKIKNDYKSHVSFKRVPDAFEEFGMLD